MISRVAAVFIVVVGASLVASGRPQTSAAPGQQFQLSVSASERGRGIEGLTKADFIIRLGNIEREVMAVDVDPRPVAVVIAMDGMIAEEALQARAALSSMLRRLRDTPGTRVGLMMGHGGATAPAMLDPVTDASALSARVSRFFGSEVTAPPQDLVAGAVEALEREESHRRVVLLASANRRAGWVQVPQSLVTRVRQSATTLVALEISTGVRQDPALQLISDAVGGVFERVPDITALESSSMRLMSTLLSAYAVSFTASEPLTGSLDVRIRNRPRALVIAPNWALR